MDKPTPPPQGVPPGRDERKRARKREKALKQFVVEEIELGGEIKPPKPIPVHKPLMRVAPGVRVTAGWVGLWAVITAATLFARGPWPMDETRLLGIAWEMWSSGNVFVPSINGEALARAPLVYWLVQLGWLGFGVVEWWARLLPALFALGSLILVPPLARRLWPENAELAAHAPYLLVGTLGMAFAAPLATNDMALVFSTLLSLLAATIMWRGRDARAWLLLAFGLGMGLLAHGALALAMVLPVVLAAPLWAHAPARPVWRDWYADVLKAVLLAAVMLAIWLVPAARQAGPGYATNFFAATLNAAALEPFPRAQPLWWYLFALPVLFLPWSVLPLAWMRWWHARREVITGGIAFCLVWIFVPLMLLTVAEIKQPQFLLPLLPALSLLTAWLLFDPKLAESSEHHAAGGFSIPLVAIGCLLAVLPALPQVEFLPARLWELSPFVGIGVVLLGVVVAWLPQREFERRTRDVAAGIALAGALVVLGVSSQFDTLQRLDPAAAALARPAGEGRPLAHIGPYHGEFQFAARLKTPLAVLEPSQAPAWIGEHPDGVIVTYSDRWQPPVIAGAEPLYRGSFRDRLVSVWEVASLRASDPQAGSP